MTLIQCPTHGLSECASVCEHIAAAVLEDQISTTIVKMYFAVNGDSEFEGVLCSVCAELLGAKKYSIYELGSPIGEQAFLLCGSVVCIDCFSLWEI